MVEKRVFFVRNVKPQKPKWIYNIGTVGEAVKQSKTCQKFKPHMVLNNIYR